MPLVEQRFGEVEPDHLDVPGGSGSQFFVEDPREVPGTHAEVPGEIGERVVAGRILLHAQAGRDPYDKTLTALVGELSTRSDDFHTRWARHDVRQHHVGAKPFHHPVVGDLDLTYESLDLAADGLILVAYGTEPGSESEDKLRLLASWAATPRPHDDRTRDAILHTSDAPGTPDAS